MTFFATIFIGVPVILAMILFYIKTAWKHKLIRIILYFWRTITIFFILFFFLLFFFPRIFGYIFDPFDTYRPNENASPIPIVSFTELEKVASFSEKFNIRFIEKSWTWYDFYGEYGVPLVWIKDDNISNILIQNNVSYMDNYLNFYTTFEINGSNRIFTLEKRWVWNLKKWDISGLWKINRILNEKWILLDKCTRNNCPELDK